MLNITKMPIFSQNQKILLENKFQNLIQSLGRDFQEFLRLNNINNSIISDILARSESNVNAEHIIHYPNEMYSSHLSSEHDSSSKLNDLIFKPDNVQFPRNDFIENSDSNLYKDFDSQIFFKIK